MLRDPKTGRIVAEDLETRLWNKARYELIPDAVTMAMLLPPMEQFVNLHSTTLHLWETKSLLAN